MALCFGSKMRVFKLIISISILACIFFPLSQCSVGTVVEMESGGEIVQVEQNDSSRTIIAVKSTLRVMVDTGCCLLS